MERIDNKKIKELVQLLQYAVDELTKISDILSPSDEDNSDDDDLFVVNK